MHLWQHDLGLLRATAVTEGRGGGADTVRVSTGKITLGQNILLPLLPGLEPTTFRSRVRTRVSNSGYNAQKTVKIRAGRINRFHLVHLADHAEIHNILCIRRVRL